MSRQAVLFAAVLALLSTSISYQFGTGTQVEQIPIILHQLDASYLSNDFYVSSTTEFGPRFYFAWLLGNICRLTSLPWAYYGLTFLTDFALVLVTFWAATRIIGSGRLGAAFSAMLVLGVSAFHLGDATQIRYEVFQPASLALPGAMWAVGLGLVGRPIQAAVVSSVVSLAHPIYGVHSGSLAIGTAFLAVFFRVRGQGLSGLDLPAIRRAVIASLIFGIAILALWWWPFREVNKGVVTSGSEIAILGRFRSPHHYLPTHFRWTDYVSTAFFVLATALAYNRWSKQGDRPNPRLLLVPMTGVALGCVLGGILTETWPIPSVFTVQPFRLLSTLKWLGFLLIGWQLAKLWQRPHDLLSRSLAGLSLLSGGVTQPLVTSAALVTLRLRGRLTSILPERALIILAGGMTGAIWFVAGSLSEGIYLTAAVGLIVALSRLPRSVRIASSIPPLAIGLALVLNTGDRPVVPLTPLVPKFDYSDLRTPSAEIAREAAARTPTDAMFVAPPTLSLLRTIGRRAMVVGHKSIPFQNWAMREWRERIREVYGEVEGGGATALDAMERSYRAIGDAHLDRLSRKYGATHAVLYAETTTAYPELYADETYRIVQLDR